MSKFSFNTNLTVDVPESFRRDLLDFCDMIENNTRSDFNSILDLILEAPVSEKKWCNYDSSIIVNFYDENKKGV